MADIATLDRPTSTPTVAECAKLCFNSFQLCLTRAATIHSRELSLVDDQLARFSLWSSNIKASISGRGSLDHRLREAPDIRDTIAAVLESLNYRIQRCQHILDSLSPIDQKSLPKIDDRLSDTLRGIADEISLLHKFSNTIRRASKEKRDRGAVEEFKIKIEDEDKNEIDIEPFLLTSFTNHIRDRFPSASEIIRQRLASTMLQRRKRILYRRSRYGKHHIRPQRVPSQPSIVKPQAPPEVGDQLQKQAVCQVSTGTLQTTAQSVTVTATTLSPQNFQKASTPSVISVSRSIALSSHEELRFPPPPSGSIQRKYRKLKKSIEREHIEKLSFFKGEGDGIARLRQKDRLAIAWDECLKAVPELICPFCFCALPVRDVIDTQKWSLLVKNDLDPYVCMFEECKSPDELYKHSHEWIDHMRGHSLRWRCTLKSHDELIFTTMDEYLTHMKTEHEVKLTDAQLKVLAQKNGRMLGPMFEWCPLCGTTEFDGSMEHHLAGHLRAFALKSLPSYEEEMEELEESDSEQTSFTSSTPRTRSTISNERREFAIVAARRDGVEYGFSYKLYEPLEDESARFVDSTVFESIHPSERRLFEWAFIPDILGLEIKPDDPVALAFSKPSGPLRRRHHRDVTRMDPDCAICHAPANDSCDCEARNLENATRMAEHRIMHPLYSQLRVWVREHADKVATSWLARSTRQQHGTEDLQPQDRENVVKGVDIEHDALSQQEQGGTWEASLKRYSEATEYFFSLPVFKLPAEEDSVVSDPPLSMIHKSHQLSKIEEG